MKKSVKNVSCFIIEACTSDGAPLLPAYVESKHAFLTPDGSAIRPELMRDVLHPSSEGMQAWFAVLKPAVGGWGGMRLKPANLSS